MEVGSHAFRCGILFYSALSSLKSHSGGQRWNFIAEDATELYVHTFSPLNRELIWDLLFDPPKPEDHRFQALLELFKDVNVREFFCTTLLYAMSDPPAAWWS